MEIVYVPTFFICIDVILMLVWVCVDVVWNKCS
jgi:hypothetical protein